jgi:hypothetical protein
MRNKFKAWIIERAMKILVEEEVVRTDPDMYTNTIDYDEALKMAKTLRRTNA